MSESLEEMVNKIGKLVDADDPTALDEARRLTEQYPMELQAWTKLAFVHSMLEQYAEAVAAETRALEIGPAQPALYYTRGGYELVRDNLEAALADFTAGIASCHEHQHTYYLKSLHFYRADVLVRLRRFDEARADLEHIPDGFKMWTTTLITKTELLAACDEKQWNWDQVAVEGLLEERLEAIDMITVRDPPKGLEYAKRLSTDCPDEPYAWDYLAYAYSMNDDHEAAVAIMQKAIDIEPVEASWYFHRAREQAELGNFAAAINDLTEAIRVCDPEKRATLFQRAYFWRADMFLLLGRKAEARADLERAPDIIGLRTTRIRMKEEMLAECDA